MSENKPLGAAALACCIEYYRAQRIELHRQYLIAKRLERRYVEMLNKKADNNDS